MPSQTILITLFLVLFVALSTVVAKPLQAGTSDTNNNSIAASAQEYADKADEVGLVKWGRDLKVALKSSEETKKPVLLLFQEVPGCHGCKKFGQEVLSNPLIVEAAENEFLPVLVYNNRGGKDAKLLKSFGEPSWNYQVIRFLNSEGKDIIPRKDKVWTTRGTAERMAQALQTQGRSVPGYLESLRVHTEYSQVSQALFFQHCFWTGEMRLGSIPGVLKTEAGFYDRRDVTKVWYDKD